MNEADIAALRAQMAAEFANFEAQIYNATPAQPPPSLTIEGLTRMVQTAEAMARQYRKTNVTFVVDQSHAGPPLVSEHPTNGKFVECNYAQATEISRVYPLRLTKVVAADRAEFEMATPLDGVFMPLCPPPYDLPEDLSDVPV